jgi:hypothetical protein
MKTCQPWRRTNAVGTQQRIRTANCMLGPLATVPSGAKLLWVLTTRAATVTRYLNTPEGDKLWLQNGPDCVSPGNDPHKRALAGHRHSDDAVVLQAFHYVLERSIHVHCNRRTSHHIRRRQVLQPFAFEQRADDIRFCDGTCARCTAAVFATMIGPPFPCPCPNARMRTARTL